MRVWTRGRYRRDGARRSGARRGGARNPSAMPLDNIAQRLGDAGDIFGPLPIASHGIMETIGLFAVTAIGQWLRVVRNGASVLKHHPPKRIELGLETTVVNATPVPREFP